MEAKKHGTEYYEQEREAYVKELESKLAAAEGQLERNLKTLEFAKRVVELGEKEENRLKAALSSAEAESQKTKRIVDAAGMYFNVPTEWNRDELFKAVAANRKGDAAGAAEQG